MEKKEAIPLPLLFPAFGLNMHKKKVVIEKGRIHFMDATATIISFETQNVEEKKAGLFTICVKWGNGDLSHAELDELLHG